MPVRLQEGDCGTTEVVPCYKAPFRRPFQHARNYCPDTQAQVISIFHGARRLRLARKPVRRSSCDAFISWLHLCAAASLPAFATVFATVHGIVHDPQHRPIAGATGDAARRRIRILRSHATTNTEGEFELPQAPIGVYRLTVTANGFADHDAGLDGRFGNESGAPYSAAVGGETQSVVVNGGPSCGRYGNADIADHAARRLRKRRARIARWERR